MSGLEKSLDSIIGDTPQPRREGRGPRAPRGPRGPKSLTSRIGNVFQKKCHTNSRIASLGQQGMMLASQDKSELLQGRDSFSESKTFIQISMVKIFQSCSKQLPRLTLSSLILETSQLPMFVSRAIMPVIMAWLYQSMTAERLWEKLWWWKMLCLWRTELRRLLDLFQGLPITEI